MHPSASTEQCHESDASTALTKRAGDSTISARPSKRLLAPTRASSPAASQPGGDTSDGTILLIDGLTPQDSSLSTTLQDTPPTPEEWYQDSPIIERHTSRLPYRSTRGLYPSNAIQRYGYSLVSAAVGALQTSEMLNGHKFQQFPVVRL
ncbi:hypothetical protein E4U19_005573 [Claviceps sp. Clav32 group G5]|nr:hypothetical protein E4U19_005573 [Claviceps sp. Clav32 group G5]